MIKKIVTDLKAAAVDIIMFCLCGVFLTYAGAALITALSIAIVFGFILTLLMWVIELCGGKDALDRI